MLRECRLFDGGRNQLLRWGSGVIAGAGCLAALVPGSALILAASSLIAKNIVGTFSQSFAEKVESRSSLVCAGASRKLLGMFPLIGYVTRFEQQGDRFSASVTSKCLKMFHTSS